MSLRSTTTFSSGQIYCCFTRCLSGRCSMLKDIPLLRAPEKSRTGMEIRPKVKCPDQTDDGISSPLVFEASSAPCHSAWRNLLYFSADPSVKATLEPPNSPRSASLAYKQMLGCTNLGARGTEMRSRREWGQERGYPRSCC